MICTQHLLSWYSPNAKELSCLPIQIGAKKVFHTIPPQTSFLFILLVIATFEPSLSFHFISSMPLVMRLLALLLCHDFAYIWFHLNFWVHCRVMYTKRYTISLDLTAAVASGVKGNVYGVCSHPFDLFRLVSMNLFYPICCVCAIRVSPAPSTPPPPPPQYLKNYNNCLFMRNHSIQ